MCTMIAQQIEIEGSGRGGELAQAPISGGWFNLRQANVSYDHPFHAPQEYALNIDFVNESLGPGARLAVELSAEAGRALAEAILAVLEQAEAGGFVSLNK
jgi:hypothetical protein